MFRLSFERGSRAEDAIYPALSRLFITIVIVGIVPLMESSELEGSGAMGDGVAGRVGRFGNCTASDLEEPGCSARYGVEVLDGLMNGIIRQGVGESRAYKPPCAFCKW